MGQYIKASLMKSLFILLWLVFACLHSLSAQKRCHCRHFIFIRGNGSAYIDGNQITIHPGDTVCIPAALYMSLSIRNIHGTQEKPVIFINCGGLVKIGAGTYGISIVNSSYFRITGTGDSTLFYGIKVFNPAPNGYDNAGIGISGTSSDAEVDHIEISKAHAGILVYNIPNCYPNTWKGSHTFRNLSFHDLYIHRIIDFGFLAGYPGPEPTLKCNGKEIKVSPQQINGISIYHCRIDSIGGGGIQVSESPEGVRIFNNTVEHYGLRPGAQAGIVMGGLVNGACYDNLVSNGNGSGIQVYGTGAIMVYNNILDRTAANNQDAIFVDDRPSPGYKPLHVYLINNTIIGSGRYAIKILNTNKTMNADNLVYNNLLLDCKKTYYFGVGHQLSHNIIHMDPVWARLDSEFMPRPGSPVIGAGMNMSKLGITTDFNGNPRRIGHSFNVGAVQILPKSTSQLIPSSLQ